MISMPNDFDANDENNIDFLLQFQICRLKKFNLWCAVCQWTYRSDAVRQMARRIYTTHTKKINVF